MKKPKLAPRNPGVALALMRKAGAHGKSRKALRRQEQIELAKEWRRVSDRADDGSFSRQVHAPLCVGFAG
ncbi:MAG: hypothetical protein FWD62_01925 [Betaproteobacteria bacterium]|jgi:hypothetical protein|nr:hypothetical protein [Betaproteobacteria bacterium]